MQPIAPLLTRWLRRVVDRLRRRPAPAPLPRFEPGTFVAAHGARDYFVYVPSRPVDGPRPLLMMLHGCTQDPADFARGTRMNALAEAGGFLVLYPAQPPRSNAAKCWNWFMPGDQRRGGGEPALLADLARDVAARHGADPARLYVAGLSAGGAMAAILAQEYPDVFAAAAVHSGLPPGAAHDVASAYAVMHTGRLRPRARPRAARRGIPTLVFHGDRDKVVHPSNGQHVVDAVVADRDARPVVQRGEAGGRPYTHAVYLGPDGRPFVEHWEVHGCGHAWSGGDPAGSHADPKGPDASREMLRFFARHRRAAA